MSRPAEAALVLAASALAAFGVSLVNFAEGGSVDAQTALTFLVFALAFGSLLAGMRAWAPSAVPFLIPLAATISAVGFVTVYRLDRELADLQRWWLLLGSGLAVLALYLMRNSGLDPLRRYRYLFLAAAIALLMLPLLPTSGPFPLHGLEVNGSRLWVKFDAGVRIQFQPGEVAKLLLVVFLASFLAERQTALSVSNRNLGRIRLPQPRQLTPVVVAWIASFAVLVYQRDLGASLLLFGAFIVMLYMATNRAAYLSFGMVMFGGGVVLAYTQFAHVQRRVEAGSIHGLTTKMPAIRLPRACLRWEAVRCPDPVSGLVVRISFLLLPRTSCSRRLPRKWAWPDRSWLSPPTGFWWRLDLASPCGQGTCSENCWLPASLSSLDFRRFSSSPESCG